MNEKIANNQRFNLLRGYYQGGEFHPAGGKGVCLDEFLDLLGFKNIAEFKSWYMGLSPEEIREGKKDWCPGDCCQSNFEWLKTDNVEEKTIRRKISPDEFKKAFLREKDSDALIEGLKTLPEGKNKPSKPIHHRSTEEARKDLESTNEYAKQHPEKLLKYLKETGQLKD